ncbi:MAG: lipopolysaccharide biosynthesis protein, partial [Sulfitobacter sp.]
AGGIGGVMFLGLAFVALMEFLNKGIRRPVELTNSLGITPFATLPYYRTKAERIRRRVIIFSILGFFLIAIPAGLWAIDNYLIPIDRLINALTKRVGMADLTSGLTLLQV